MKEIEALITESEKKHRGEIRFAVEAGLDPGPVWKNVSARERAIDVFSMLRIWDTEENTGVLIYLLLADRDIEIIADRGINKVTGSDLWEEICQEMEQMFRDGRFPDGVKTGIERITGILAEKFPHIGEDENELPNQPVVL